MRFDILKPLESESILLMQNKPSLSKTPVSWPKGMNCIKDLFFKLNDFDTNLKIVILLVKIKPLKLHYIAQA